MNESYFVSLPLNDLLSLQASLSDINQFRSQLLDLNERVKGLHRTLFDLMIVVNELRKECQS